MLASLQQVQCAVVETSNRQCAKHGERIAVGCDLGCSCLATSFHFHFKAHVCRVCDVQIQCGEWPLHPSLRGIGQLMRNEI